MKGIRVGTRGSPLAVWQAQRVANALRAGGAECELVPVVTTGDGDRETPLARLGKPAVFSKELDDGLLDGRIDVAVHSLKDLPTDFPPGVVLAAVGEREDPRDALIGRGPLTWSTLAPGATLATSSLRRQAQLRRLRPDLRVVDIRGNIGTRLEQLEGNQEWEGLILAVAGLVRLGLGHRIGERLPLSQLLPAPAQGALAVTCRADEVELEGFLRRTANHAAVELAVTAERSLLSAVEGGCHAPVAAYAEFDRSDRRQLTLRARIVSLDGREVVEGLDHQLVGDLSDAIRLGERLAGRLLSQGADRIIEQARVAMGQES